MIIKPLTKKDGSVYTNVELVKICYDKLDNMRNGVGANTKREKEKMEDDFLRICGGSENATNLMSFMKQIVDVQDEAEAQRLFSRALIPVDIIKNNNKGEIKSW